MILAMEERLIFYWKRECFSSVKKLIDNSMSVKGVGEI
jgi:hypothetical protein